MIGVLDTCHDECQKANAKKITRITLTVGERSGVVISALEFAFTALTKDTNAEGAKLVIESVPCKGVCLQCNNEFFSSAEGFLICDRCGGYGRVISGQELNVTSIEVET